MSGESRCTEFLKVPEQVTCAGSLHDPRSANVPVVLVLAGGAWQHRGVRVDATAAAAATAPAGAGTAAGAWVWVVSDVRGVFHVERSVCDVGPAG